MLIDKPIKKLLAGSSTSKVVQQAIHILFHIKTIKHIIDPIQSYLSSHVWSIVSSTFAKMKQSYRYKTFTQSLVPQGSISRTHLFIVYINDVCNLKILCWNYHVCRRHEYFLYWGIPSGIVKSANDILISLTSSVLLFGKLAPYIRNASGARAHRNLERALILYWFIRKRTSITWKITGQFV